jgi:hypothetical protein
MIAMAKPFIKSGAKHFDTISKVVDTRKTIEVYRNLHKKCWSIRQGGKVVCHTDYITLKDCKFIVQPAGRERVVREKKKNVHAFVRGLLCSPRESDHTPPFSWEFVKYNPYKSGSFYFDHTGGGIYQAKFVDMDIDDAHGILAWGWT